MTKQIVIELPDEAVDHAETMARSYGFANAADHIKEWLVNTAQGYELEKQKRYVAKLETRVRADTVALYGADEDTAQVISLPLVR